MPKDDLHTSNQNEQKPQDKIEIVDENLKQGFAQMPRPVLRAKGLSLKAKAVYLLLLDYAWQTDSCFPGQERLAADLDTSVDTIQRGLQELRAYGLVDWKRQGLNKPNIYLILKLSDCKKLTHSEAETANSGIKKPQDCGIKKPQKRGINNTQSKNTKIKNTKSFRKAHALTTEKGEEGTQASARSHRERMATGKQNTRGVKNGNTKQERQLAYIGKPLTQEEIDEKRKNGQNASGFTPLAGIIPVSHWQELEASFYPSTNGNRNGNGNGNLHYHHTTKNAPLSIDATIEQLSTLLHDEPENTAQNINRAAKLCKQVGYDSDQFANLLWSIYHELKKKPDKLFKTRRADGRANKMPVFFTELEKALGVKPKRPIRPANEFYNGKVVANQKRSRNTFSVEKNCHVQDNLTSCPLYETY